MLGENASPGAGPSLSAEGPGRLAHEVGLDYLKKIPRENLWRLGVDGQFHAAQSGWQGYEGRELGSIPRLMGGLLLSWEMLKLNASISLELILAFYAHCSGKSETHALRDNKTMDGRPVWTAIDLIRGDSLSPDGLKSLSDMAEAYRGWDFSLSLNSFSPMFVLGKEVPEGILMAKDEGKFEALQTVIMSASDQIGYIAPRNTAQKIQEKINQFLQQYQDNIQRAKTAEEKLTAIVTVVAQLDRLHPFEDYNIRTFGVVLLNYLLMQNGFPPAMMRNPNVFDGFSIAELVIEVNAGIVVTQEAIEGKKRLYDFETTPTLDAQFQKTCPDFYARFTQLMSTQVDYGKLLRNYANQGKFDDFVHTISTLRSAGQSSEDIRTLLTATNSADISAIRYLSSAEVPKSAEGGMLSDAEREKIYQGRQNIMALLKKERLIDVPSSPCSALTFGIAAVGVASAVVVGLATKGGCSIQ